MSKKMKITLAVIVAFIVCTGIAVYLSVNGHEEEGKSQAIFVSRQERDFESGRNKDTHAA